MEISGDQNNIQRKMQRAPAHLCEYDIGMLQECKYNQSDHHIVNTVKHTRHHTVLQKNERDSRLSNSGKQVISRIYP